MAELAEGHWDVGGGVRYRIRRIQKEDGVSWVWQVHHHNEVVRADEADEESTAKQEADSAAEEYVASLE